VKTQQLRRKKIFSSSEVTLAKFQNNPCDITRLEVLWTAQFFHVLGRCQALDLGLLIFFLNSDKLLHNIYIFWNIDSETLIWITGNFFKQEQHSLFHNHKLTQQIENLHNFFDRKDYSQIFKFYKYSLKKLFRYIKSIFIPTIQIY
jgi:hypothetical protein